MADVMTRSGSDEVGGFGPRLKRAIRRRVVWLTDRRRDLEGGETRAFALVAILGREHYIERRKSYPILAWRDLAAVVRQELHESPATLAVISPLRDNQREVTFFECSSDVIARAGRAVWLVPESLAIAASLPAGQIATVQRAAGSYFVAASGVSQPSGGAVTSAELFAIAAGLNSDTFVQIADSEVESHALSGLRRLPLDAWFRLRNPALSAGTRVAWTPIFKMAATLLIAYLVLASAYLNLTQRARERELASLGTKVESLLVAQRDVDRLLAEQSGLAAVLGERRDTYRLWQVVAVAWRKGAVINNVDLKDATLTLRGSAPVATDVLAAVGEIPGFADAKFSSPVQRGESGQEEFSLQVTMQARADRG